MITELKKSGIDQRTEKLSLALMINELALVPVHPLLCREELVSCLSTICQHYQRSITERLGEAKWCSLPCIKQCISKLSRTNIPNTTGIQSYSRKISNGWFCWSASCHYAMICKNQKRALSLTKRALMKTYVYQNIYQKRKD